MATIHKEDMPSYLLTIGRVLNVLVLIGSLVIFAILSIEILKGTGVIPHNLYMNIQLIICLFFFFEFWYSFYISRRRLRYFITHILFLLVSIPYVNIIDWMHLPTTPLEQIFLRAIILIRGGYGLVIVVTWFTKSKITNLFYSYLLILIAMAYFGSLVFYVLEKNVNSSLHNYQDSLWWACMDVTTVGCAIEPVTSEGRILAVVLAVMGMIMFPIFTAFLTDRFQKRFQDDANK